MSSFDSSDLFFSRYIEKKYNSTNFEQLMLLRDRNRIQFDKVVQVFNCLVYFYPNFKLPEHYLIDKPEVAFVFRFNMVAFHVVFNVVSDDEPEDTKTDKVLYSVQRFYSNQPLTQFESVEMAIEDLVDALVEDY
jgi:hypothetical protein